jgi:hypothetical protein
MCDKFLCTVGDSDNELIQEETNFYIEKADLENYFFIKIIEIEFLKGLPVFYYSFDVIKISDFLEKRNIYKKKIRMT